MLLFLILSRYHLYRTQQTEVGGHGKKSNSAATEAKIVREKYWKLILFLGKHLTHQKHSACGLTVYLLCYKHCQAFCSF